MYLRLRSPQHCYSWLDSVLIVGFYNHGHLGVVDWSRLRDSPWSLSIGNGLGRRPCWFGGYCCRYSYHGVGGVWSCCWSGRFAEAGKGCLGAGLGYRSWFAGFKCFKWVLIRPANYYSCLRKICWIEHLYLN